MKNRFLLLLLFVGLQTLFSSCQQDDTTVFNAQKIAGNWAVTEFIDSSSESYNVSISYDETTKKLQIVNFYNLGVSYVATGTVQDDFTITIAEQEIDSRKISGKGSVSSDYKTIEWAYTVVEGTSTVTQNVTANYSKSSTAKSMELTQKK